MSDFTNKTFLKGQYQNAANLNARMALHERFSENPYGWFAWVFDQLTLPDTSSVLELGCGSGDLWQSNQDRLPASWELTLTDLSAGMTAKARRNLAQIHSRCYFASVDAQALPFRDGSFSVVIANHMLYHVPNRERAFIEIQRVLVRGGRLYATTIGEDHLAEINELARQFDAGLAAEYDWGSNGFTLENGAEQLSGWFSSVQLFRYPDSLWVTEAEPLADYILSCTRFGIDRQRRQDLIGFIQLRLDQSGGIKITKDSGLFVASNP